MTATMGTKVGRITSSALRCLHALSQACWHSATEPQTYCDYWKQERRDPGSIF